MHAAYFSTETDERMDGILIFPNFVHYVIEFECVPMLDIGDGIIAFMNGRRNNNVL